MKPSRGRFVRLLAALAAVTLIFGASASLAAGETAVTITGVSVAGKTYDGTPAEASGTPVAKDGDTTVTISSGDYVYTYSSTDGGGSRITGSCPLPRGPASRRIMRAKNPFVSIRSESAP